MYHEITVRLGSEEYTAFLQNGFFNSNSISPIHKHNYAEVHIIANGKAEFDVGEKKLTLDDGGMLIIPSKLYHCCHSADEGTLHSAFQIDLDCAETCVYSVPPSIINEFFRQIGSYSESDGLSLIPAFVTLICSYFRPESRKISKESDDYGFLIHEFFTINYNKDVKLSQLAESLYLSERQAERLVLEHTGRSFRDELTAMRIEIAKHLLSTTDMNLGEIATYVGYRSYAGFWKAMKKSGMAVEQNPPTS